MESASSQAGSGPESARKRKLTPVGRSWKRGLHVSEMQLPQPIVTVLVLFDQAPTLQALADAFERHVWPMYRFSSRVESDADFVPMQEAMDRAYHFEEKSVTDRAAIDAYVQGVMCRPLDPKHPLWQVAVLRAGQGMSAVVLRIHHAISDGLGLLFAFLPMLECEGGGVLDKIPLPGALLGRARPRREPASAYGRPQCGFLRRLLGWLCDAPRAVRMFLRGVLSIVLVKPDSELRINPPLGQRLPFLPFSGRHRFVPMPPVPMTVVKAVRERQSCTVNDAVMAALTGAIRRYCAEELQDPLFRGAQPLECKATMLLALRRPISAADPGVSLANQIVTPVFRLPVDEPLAAGRLRRTVAMCNDLKSTAYLTGIRLITKLLSSVAPTRLMQKIASEALSKMTANVTSVPMANVPVQFCGKEIKELQAIFVNNVPQVSMITYDGFLHWNMVADPLLIADPARIGAYFLSELEELAKQ